jgi:hypothetical protein
LYTAASGVRTSGATCGTDRARTATPTPAGSCRGQRAKKLIQEENLEPDEAIEQAAAEVEVDREAERILGEAEAARAEQDDTDRLLRSRVQVNAQVSVEYQDGLESNGKHYDAGVGLIPPQQLQTLRRAKVPETVIASMGSDKAKSLTQKIIMRYKKKLSTYGQCNAMIRAGYSKAEASAMSMVQASAALDTVSKNGWKRPIAA